MAVDTKLAMHVQKCVKNLTSLKITISKSDDNEEKFFEIRKKVGEVLNSLSKSEPSEDEVIQACSVLKDTVSDYNDAGDNLEIKNAARGFASIIGRIDSEKYKDFSISLMEKDIEVINFFVESAKLSPDDLMRQAWNFYNEQRYDDAFRTVFEAKEKGSLFAYYLLAMLYQEGKGVSRNAQTAYSIFLEGAQKGEISCQYQVYLYLLSGVDVQRNLEAAFKWLCIAAENQHPLAMLEYGKFLCGEGVAEYDKAFEYINKSANADVEEAKAWIGYCYEMGYGVLIDIQKAKNIYRQEMANGNKYATEFYDRLIAFESQTAQQNRWTQENNSSAQVNNQNTKKNETDDTKGWGCGCLILLAILAGILWAGYQFWYKDYKRDKDAPRTYVFADNLFMRSTAVADVEYNRLGTIPYGSELITYSEENGWAYVKANGETGYVSKDFILNAQDFQLLNGVWGNIDAKEVVATSKCRLAVLDYLKSGNLKTGSTGWQIFTKQKEMKPNSVLFPRLNNGYDNFTEFAFIIKNNENGSRKLVLYSFKEDESPVFVYSEDAPEQGDIKSISYNRWSNKYNVTYSRSNSYITQPKKEVKNVVKQESSLTISSVAFANTDYNRNIITNYGQQLYTNMQYLQPKVFYKKSAVGTTKIKLQVKIIRPDGTVIRGKTSPVDYTFEQEVNLSGTNGYIELMGWGNNEGGVYSEGDYKYEIWSEGKKLFSTIVYIKNKVDSISITAVSFANVTYDGKTLNKYGEQLYCTTQYLQSRFHYTKKKDTTEQITLQIKIFKPNGEMLSGSSSPKGFTFDQKVTLSGKSGTCTILGWGNKSGTSYSVGNYRYEIWMNDNELLSTSIVTFK
ncbi:SH3 domain-containing protein [uncultured Bacteroides sp.]|uniref:SH3 domain-containing protein n=1 Tax=uncultured Bacteroides sp. TaxID=162156 RepID=UPI002607C5B5|nr:SH3 domain-containing protein [uncultured Bacteroides sp.]